MTQSEQFHLEILDKISDVATSEWNSLLSDDSGPFLRHEFLSALEETGCVGKDTGWQIAHLILRHNAEVIGAMPLYLKQHSYGEYVFDWSWAQAYAQQGMNYYPKVLCAIPFTPVQGSRLLSKLGIDKALVYSKLVYGLKSLVIDNHLSSAHVLFPQKDGVETLKAHGFLLRDSVQFHWHNQHYQSFDDFLSSLTMKRRKNIRRERELVAAQNILFRHIPGRFSSEQDWEFFYACYANTYFEHQSQPYLNLSFFKMLAQRLPENLHLIVAEKNGSPIASSLMIMDATMSKAYGRYWGAIEHIPLLHFETAYYQAIEHCITQGIQTFEGGAQGEHKMARGFLPTTIQSAHFIKDPKFSMAVEQFLLREHQGIAAYVDELAEHSPMKSAKVPI